MNIKSIDGTWGEAIVAMVKHGLDAPRRQGSRGVLLWSD